MPFDEPLLAGPEGAQMYQLGTFVLLSVEGLWRPSSRRSAAAIGWPVTAGRVVGHLGPS